MSLFQLMFIVTLPLVNNLTCNLSVSFSAIRMHRVFLTPLLSTCLCPSTVNSSCLRPVSLSSKKKPAHNYGFYLRGRNLTTAFQSTAPPTKTSAICHCCVRGAACTTGISDRVYFSSVGSRLFMPPSVTSVQADTWLTDKAARPPCCLQR